MIILLAISARQERQAIFGQTMFPKDATREEAQGLRQDHDFTFKVVLLKFYPEGAGGHPTAGFVNACTKFSQDIPE